MQISSLASYLTTAAAKPSGSANLGATSAGSEGGEATAGVEQEFLKFAKMSPLDRLRASILKDMGLTEDSLKSLSPSDRQAVEQKIKEMVEQQLHKNPTQTGQLTDVTA
jgi:hypothetical protein